MTSTPAPVLPLGFIEDCHHCHTSGAACTFTGWHGRTCCPDCPGADFHLGDLMDHPNAAPVWVDCAAPGCPRGTFARPDHLANLTAAGGWYCGGHHDRGQETR